MIQSKEIGSELQKRSIDLVNLHNIKMIKTANKTIMDYIQIYVENRKLSINIIPPINHIRMYKKMYLPCELIGLCGNKKTREFREGLETSSIRQKVKFVQVPRPSAKSLKIWQDFIEWLSKQSIRTVNDFDDQIECRYQK